MSPPAGGLILFKIVLADELTPTTAASRGSLALAGM